MTEIADVTEERAKKMGVTISSRANGDAGIKVSLEFRVQGELEKFRWIELRMTTAGEHLVSAPLLTSPSATGNLSASFSAAPSSLSECEFWVYVADVPLGGTAYRFKVADFVESNVTKEARNTEEQKTINIETQAEQGGAEQPATVSESKLESKEDIKPVSGGRSK
jgi:hypothetical protein